MEPAEAIAAAWPSRAWRDLTVLLAVSGGADSMALLRAVLQRAAAHEAEPAAGRVVVAHFNHRLRGSDSDEDERFVADECRRLGVALEVGRWETPLADRAQGGDGLEAAARDARLDFLRRTAERLGARYVATAHTADDQAETILQRIVRGTGLAGLAGIRRVRPLGPAVTLVRPMLAVRRADVLSYLADLGQTFRPDAMNEDPRFTRNRIRRDLLPKLAREYNPHVVDAMIRLGRLAGECQEVIDHVVNEWFERSVARMAGQAMVDAAVLATAPRYVVREVFIRLWREMAWPSQQMGFVEWDQLAEWAVRLSLGEALCPRDLPGAVRAAPEGTKLVVRRAAGPPQDGV